MKRLSLYAGVLLTSALVLGIAFPSGVSSALPRSFVYPLLGTRVSSDFGTRVHPVRKVKRHHGGIDLAAPMSAPIRAVAAGTVTFADPYKGFGKLVVIRHSGGMTTHYGHCESLKVRPGQKVSAGEIIATVGKSGLATGPHLHFEVRIDGKARDPQDFIPALAHASEG
jgi:murein DD-endopeptidase MepM/ murein hydrolase activator NlpD